MIDTKKIVKSVFAQAELGEVVIGKDTSSPWSFYAKFGANIEGREHTGVDYPTIDIPDFETFLEKVESYLSVAEEFYADDKEYYDLDSQAFKEKLFFDLMVNTSSFDQKNILAYIENREKMLKEVVPCGEKYIGSYEGKRVYSCVKKNRSNIESPYKMTFTFKSEEGEFSLPSLNFGKIDDRAYLFAVQNKREKQTSILAKKMDRHFRKLNSGVDMEDIVATVSPNAVASLTIFASTCEKSGVKNIVAPDFLPIRYIASHSAKERLDEEKKEEGIEKLDRDQFNITNKFMHLFLRYNFHFPKAEADYDENIGLMTMTLDSKERNGENIIFDLCNLGSREIFSAPDKKAPFTR